ncbi:MAG: hypothetical protein GC193_00850 [Cryomorphaceae bacterium]|nr:hypothetical protein [Cryomorphaceae bacterium]
MFSKFLMTITIVIASLSVSAQLNEEVWTLGGKQYLGEGFRRWKFDFIFDGRNSIANGKPVNIGGLRMGLEYKRVHRFGVGIYNFNQALSLPQYNNGDTLVSPSRFTFGYGSLYYERVLLLHRKWEVSGTIHLGRGNVAIDYFDTRNGIWTRLEDVSVRPIELSASGYHHLSWWLSAGLGVGHRWMFETPNELLPLYNSTVYLAKVKIRIGKVLRAIGNKNVKNEY